MPPDLGQMFVPTFAGRPVHMSAVDFVLWRRLLALGPLPFTRLYFDVAVGEGAEPAAGADPKIMEAWLRITRQRIDVVGVTDTRYTIIELRGAAGPGAIGSLLVYRDLWALDPPDDRPLDLWLVTDVFPSNLRHSLDLLDIRLYLV